MPPFNTNSPLHICIIKLTFRDKHEPRTIQIIKKEIIRSNNRLLSHLYEGECITTYIYRRPIGLPMNNRGIQPIILAQRTKL